MPKLYSLFFLFVCGNLSTNAIMSKTYPGHHKKYFICLPILSLFSSGDGILRWRNDIKIFLYYLTLYKCYPPLIPGHWNDVVVSVVVTSYGVEYVLTSHNASMRNEYLPTKPVNYLVVCVIIAIRSRLRIGVVNLFNFWHKSYRISIPMDTLTPNLQPHKITH